MGSSALYLKRYERKFLFDEETYREFMSLTGEMFVPDKFAKSTICNIYFDTPDYLLIRRSIEKPKFKEKLRLRTYEPPEDDTTAFCEIKRKIEHVVYKRRISMDYKTAFDYLTNRVPLKNPGQISKEIDWMFTRYEKLVPAMKVAYERESYAAADKGSPLRVTFDRNIIWDNNDFDYRGKPAGNKLLPEGLVLMELKIGDSMPLTILDIMRKLDIFKASFSKYGNAYRVMMGKKPSFYPYISGLNAGKYKEKQ